MRTQEDIDQDIINFTEKEKTEKVEAILDVLENDLDHIEIEEKCFNESDPWVEQSALSALEFLEGEIQFNEITWS